MGLERREKQSNLYARLQQESITLLQQLCSERWSDFNAHDPGITLAEITNYALYELDYQLSFPFEAYAQLAGSPLTGLPAADLLSVPTLTTPAEYEQLILTHTEEVSRCKVTYEPEGYYTIALTVIPHTNHNLIKTKVTSLYHANRNLCETVGQVEITGEAPRTTSPRPATGIEFESGREIPPYPLPTNSCYRLRNHLPGCYTVNNNYQKQTDAYLLIFDHLLANTRQQARQARMLFDLSLQEPPCSPPDIDAEGTPELIDQEKKENSLLTSRTFSYRQRSRYLDLLDTFHAENSRKYFQDKALPLSNQLRASLLVRYPVINQQRFRAFNILSPLEHGAGAQEIISRLAGFRTSSFTRLCNIFSRYHIQLKDDTTFFTRVCHTICFTDDHNLKHTIPLQHITYEDDLYEFLYQHIGILRQDALYESFLIYGDNIRNYSFIYTEENKFVLLFDVPCQSLILTLGSFTETRELIYTANLLCSFISHLRSITSSLFLIEHMLLEDLPENSYRLSLILPRWSKGVCKPEKLRELALKRLPAHLEIRLLWLKEKDFTRFEKLYLKWRQALAKQDQVMICNSATLLAGLLAQWPFKTYNDYEFNW